MKMKITLGEIYERWQMSDKACDILGLNPWCIAEGAWKGDTISISPEQAEKLGIHKNEFIARQIED